MIDIRIIENMKEMLRYTPTDFHRYLYNEVDWNLRLVGITGPRGVGKSTMILQYIKEHSPEDALFVSADNIYFSNHTLIDLADDFVKENGKHLYIDEVHKYSGWSRELKQIYDVHPDLKIVFTGSSILDIKKGYADLSRRAVMYSMQGLSFREYLELFHNIKVRSFTLDEILENKVEIADLEHPLPYFRKYLKEGYYPFGIEGQLQRRILQTVDQTIEVDIAQYADLKATTARKLKRLLSIVSQLAPFKPVADNLAKDLSVSKNNVPEYLVYLDQAGMIALLRDDTGGLQGLGKVQKAYIDNPTLMNALSVGEPNPGNMRETFFYNQMRVKNAVTASKVADFRIGDITFEVGGKGKGFSQLKGVTRGYVVKDDIEYGSQSIIPLWHFGLNY